MDSHLPNKTIELTSPPMSPVLHLLPSAPLLIFRFLVLFLLMIIVKQYWKRSKTPTTKLPPGPWKLPLLGNLHQLIGHPPYRRMRDLAKKHGPIMRLQLGQPPAIVITSQRIAEEVLKRHDPLFAQRPQLFASGIVSYKDGSSLLCSPYNDSWRQLRKICLNELLSAQRIQLSKSIREEEVQNLIESIQSSHLGTPINIREKMSFFVSNITSRVAIGSKCEDQDKFMSTLEEISAAGGFCVQDMFPSLKFLYFMTGKKAVHERLHQRLDKFLDAILNKLKSERKFTSTSSHKYSREETLVDVLLRIQESDGQKNPMTTNTIKMFMTEIFGAASESTSTTIEWAMSEIMRNPRVMEKAQAQVRKALKGKSKIEERDIQELEYLKAIVKETLRLHPPFPMIARESRERCEIKGYEIPAKTMVVINGWAMSRDPTYWVNAESFQPERWFLMGSSSSSSISFKGTDFEYIPFGAGRRICPGIPFAMTVVELALAQLLYHFDWQLPNGTKPEELDMTDILTAVLKKKNNLYLIPKSFHSFV